MRPDAFGPFGAMRRVIPAVRDPDRYPRPSLSRNPRIKSGEGRVRKGAGFQDISDSELVDLRPLAGALQPAGAVAATPGPAPGRVPEDLSDRTRGAIAEYFAGRRSGARSALLFAGPAVLASTAYMDPGNFAVNIEAGATYFYALLWVVLAAHVIAMLFQALSAKLDIATGQNLAQLCRFYCPMPLCWTMWVGSEIAAMATDLAEFLGAAIGLALLFKLPLLVGMGVAGLLTCAVLALD